MPSPAFKASTYRSNKQRDNHPVDPGEASESDVGLLPIMRNALIQMAVMLKHRKLLVSIINIMVKFV